MRQKKQKTPKNFDFGKSLKGTEQTKHKMGTKKMSLAQKILSDPDPEELKDPKKMRKLEKDVAEKYAETMLCIL